MSRVLPWAERKFAFDFPAALYPNVCVRVRGAPAQLEELTAGLLTPVICSGAVLKYTISEFC